MIYIGQNSANGATTQGRLKEYCDGKMIAMILYLQKTVTNTLANRQWNQREMISV